MAGEDIGCTAAYTAYLAARSYDGATVGLSIYSAGGLDIGLVASNNGRWVTVWETLVIYMSRSCTTGISVRSGSRKGCTS